MAYDDLRSSGNEPAYEGPFTLVRRQRGVTTYYKVRMAHNILDHPMA
jgi:hypothetical protein